MSNFPYLPLNVEAYRRKTAHLSLEEHGAYLSLIMLAWNAPGCRLPDDDVRLARMLGVTAKKWAALKPAIMSFWVLEDGFWSQKRLTEERDFVSRRAKVSADNGKHGGRPKCLKNNKAANPAGSSQDARQEPGSKAPNTLHPTQDKALVEPTEIHPEKPESDTGAAAPRSARGGKAYFFENGVIRLTEPDFRKWEKAFPNVSLHSELMGLTGWAGEQANWFFAVPGALAKREREMRLSMEETKARVAAQASAVAKPKIPYLGP